MGLLYNLLTQFDKAEKKEPLVADLLPWGYFIGPGLILNKNLSLQKTIYIKGKDYISSSDTLIQSTIEQLNYILTNSLGDGYALYIDSVHTTESSYKESFFPSKASQIIERERSVLYTTYPHFVTKNYITFVYQLQSEQEIKRQDALFAVGTIKDFRAREIARFCEHIQVIIGALDQVTEVTYELDDEETLAYLHNTVSDKAVERINVPEYGSYLDTYLPDTVIETDPIRIGNDFVGVLSLYDYPHETSANMLYGLEHMAMEYRWIQRYIVFSKERAIKETRRRSKGWFAKNNARIGSSKGSLEDNISVNKGLEADIANQRAGASEIGFGQHTGTLIVKFADEEKLYAAMEYAENVFLNAKMIVRRESFNAGQAWLGSIPGNIGKNPRRAMIHSRNVAHLFPINSVWNGDFINKHLEKISGVGTPHVRCSSVGGNLFNLNLNVGDVGHTLVTGPTGSGKSTLLAFLVAQWFKYPDAQVIIFDKDRSAQAITQAVGGIFYNLGASDKDALRLMPLSELYDTEWTSFYKSWLLSILELEHVEKKSSHIQLIGEAIENVRALKKHAYTLERIASTIQDNELRAVYRDYAHTWRSVIGETDDYLDINNKLITFEMAELMTKGEKIILPVLEYLFKRVDIRFTGAPTLLILDEAWLFLRHPVFANKLLDWLKTLRKKNVFVILATQELSDFIDSPIRETIISATATKIYLANPSAHSPIMERNYKMIGLTPEEVEIISRMYAKRQYYYKSVSGDRVFELDLGAVALRLLTQKSEEDAVGEHIKRVLLDISSQYVWIEDCLKEGDSLYEAAL